MFEQGSRGLCPLFLVSGKPWTLAAVRALPSLRPSLPDSIRCAERRTDLTEDYAFDVCISSAWHHCPWVGDRLAAEATGSLPLLVTPALPVADVVTPGPPKSYRKKARRFNAAEDAKLKDMLGEGYSLNEIADALGRYKSVVQFRIRRLRKRNEL